MIFSHRPKNYYNTHVFEYINYVTKQCVDFSFPLSLFFITELDSEYKLLYKCSSFPPMQLLHKLSIYFDAMSIDVHKDNIDISLSMDINKDLLF